MNYKRFGIVDETSNRENTVGKLEIAIAKALAASDKVEAGGVEITAAPGGSIVLSGSLKDPKEIKYCLEIVLSVPGVHSVQSHILLSDNGIHRE
jgi:osmotically-inducible protein OsmY